MSEKKINGRIFRCEPMLATEAIILQARLMRVLGSAASELPALIASRRDGATDEQKAMADVKAISAITGIFAGCEPKELADLTKTIVEAALIQRDSGQYGRVDLDGDFTGRLQDIIPIVIFVLKEQFGDFFSGALANTTRKAVA